MKKQTVETFIKKYSLNGLVDSVKWTVDSDKKTLTTNAITEEKNVLIAVEIANFDAIDEKCELGVFETSRLSKMLSVLSDTVTLSLNKKDDKITSVGLSDDNDTVAQFITSDLAVIPSAPALKKLPDFGVEILLDTDFVSRFVKAKNALPEVDTFTLLMNKKSKLEMVLGHSTLNSNRITLGVDAVDGKNVVKKNVSFNAKYFKEILVANNDCPAAVLRVSDAGLSTVEFANADFKSTYYMVEVKMVD
jgi:hypothetical protein